MKKRKYSKNLEPLIPFFEKAFQIAKVDPNRIVRIRGYMLPLNKDDKQAAQVTYEGNGYYSMTFKLSEAEYQNLGNRKFKKIKSKKCSLAYLLDSIAHEVSHVKNWEHDAGHLRCQSRIMLAFAAMVRKLEITDTSKQYDKALKEMFDKRTIS